MLAVWCYLTYGSFYFHCCDTIRKSNFGRKRFTWLTVPHHSPSSRKVRAGTQAGAEAGTGRKAAYWLVPSGWCSANYVAQPRPTYLAMAHSGLGPLKSISNHDSAPQTQPQANLMEDIAFVILFPGDSRLCQVYYNQWRWNGNLELYPEF